MRPNQAYKFFFFFFLIYTAKETINKRKRQPTDWGKIFKMMRPTRA